MKEQAQAQLKDLRISPRKVRLLVDVIRAMNVDDALSQLRVSKKDAAKPLRKLLESAIANALTNHYLKRDSLKIEKAFVDGGRTLHRWTPRAMGRATPIRKRTSHITLVLSGLVDDTKKHTQKKSRKSEDENEKEEALTTESKRDSEQTSAETKTTRRASAAAKLKKTENS
ncbi:MAG: 50S ribosomal protein L22 [Candidatus Magasanikbacteria bacterium]|nr:50S ribosomal protein L22 [Candidatus Magasanikbacteria bacterium]